MKRFFAALTLLPMLLAITAHAAVSEIRKDFLNLTSLLPATRFISAPGATGSYLVCVYLAQPGSENAISVVLRWTDENNLPQSFTFSAPAGPINSCNPIRNHAGTAATIETDGAYPGCYDLFVTGFGFWPTGTQGQGGITRPIARDFVDHFDGVLLTPAATGDYLMALWPTEGAWTLGWTDSQGPQSVNGVASNNGYAFPIHALAGTDITFSGGWPNEPAYVYALHFGTPAAGAGPVTDYELNLLNYTNVKWPNWVNVLNSTSPGMYVFAGNIACAGERWSRLPRVLRRQFVFADPRGQSRRSARHQRLCPAAHRNCGLGISQRQRSSAIYVQRQHGSQSQRDALRSFRNLQRRSGRDQVLRFIGSPSILNCHPEQALFAQRGMWASRADRPRFLRAN